MPKKISKKLVGYIFVALAAALWGSFSVVSKIFFSNAYLDPIEITQLRALTSGVCLFLIMLVLDRKSLKVDKKTLGNFFILGLTIIHVQLFLLFTIKLIDVSIASFVQYLAPALIFGYSVLYYKEPVKTRDLVALGLAIIGVLLLITASYRFQLNPIGIITALWTAAALAIYTLYSKTVVDKHNPWAALTYAMLSAATLLCIVFPPSLSIFDGFPYHIPLFLLYLGFFTTIIPYGLYLLGLRFIKPHEAGITATLEPVVALLLSGILALETLTAMKLSGCFLIICSVFLLTAVAPSQPSKKESPPSEREGTPEISE